MGLLTLIQIPCHHALANEIALNLKWCIGLKHFFNINFGIGIIRKLLFCLYFRHISPCFYSNFDQESSLDVEQQALPIEIWVKTQGDMSKIQTKKVVFLFSSSKINKYYFIIFTIILLIFLGGPFWVEISSNDYSISKTAIMAFVV